jgi:hypothetical protein
MFNLTVDLFNGIFVPELIIFFKTFNILRLLPEMDSLTIATFILAFATIALALMNYLSIKDSNKNIKISKENLIEQHLLREMEQLIKPLYENRKEFEYLEQIHAYSRSEAIDYWKKREADKYLAAKDLRLSMEEYLAIDNELYKKYKYIVDKIWAIFDKDQNERTRIVEQEMRASGNLFRPPNSPSDKYEELKNFLFSGIGGRYSHNLPRSSERSSWLEKVDELITKLEPDSEILLCVKEIKDLVEDDINLKAKREGFIKKVETRYSELEEKIDNIHESLDKT